MHRNQVVAQGSCLSGYISISISSNVVDEVQLCINLVQISYASTGYLHIALVVFLQKAIVRFVFMPLALLG